MYKLIRKWESSGVSQTKFFDEYNISKSTFGYWRKKYLRDQTRKKDSGRMVPVQVQPQNPCSLSKEQANIEIVYPNGVRVFCSTQMEAKSVKDLIY